MGIKKLSKATNSKLKMKIACLLAASASAFVAKPQGETRLCDFYKQVAVANFDNGFGASDSITLTQEGCKHNVTIEGTLTGLGAGSHGWHIHQLANLDMTAENPCAPAYTGGHFNPFDAPSGHYDDNRRNREVGQIGQINCDDRDNCVSEQDEDKLIKLNGLRNVLGRSIVIHQDPEYPGPSGSRIACAVIVLKEFTEMG